MKKLILFKLVFFPFFVAAQDLSYSSKGFSENIFLSELVAVFLKQKGYKLQRLPTHGTVTNRKRLLENKSLFYWEYTGTAYKNFLNGDDEKIAKNPKMLHSFVKENDSKNNGVLWGEPLQVNNTFAFAMKRGLSEKTKIKTISDLLKWKGPLRIGIEETYFTRREGWAYLKEFYEFNNNRLQFVVKKMDHLFVPQALSRNQIHVGMVFGTDFIAVDPGYILLVDNKKFFPVYNPAITMKIETSLKYPEVLEIGNFIAKNLTKEDLIRLIHPIEKSLNQFETVQSAARTWLKTKGMIE